jgi:hypothetical protein
MLITNSLFPLGFRPRFFVEQALIRMSKKRLDPEFKKTSGVDFRLSEGGA